MRSDPPVRRDGKCAHCGGDRQFTVRKGIPREQYESDPFCRTECAKAYHGVQTSGVSGSAHVKGPKPPTASHPWVGAPSVRPRQRSEHARRRAGQGKPRL